MHNWIRPIINWPHLSDSLNSSIVVITDFTSHFSVIKKYFKHFRNIIAWYFLQHCFQFPSESICYSFVDNKVIFLFSSECMCIYMYFTCVWSPCLRILQWWSRCQQVWGPAGWSARQTSRGKSRWCWNIARALENTTHRHKMSCRERTKVQLLTLLWVKYCSTALCRWLILIFIWEYARAFFTLLQNTTSGRPAVRS